MSSGTGPTNSITDSRGDRTYVWPPEPPHELSVPSVTTIIGNGIPKPALPRWAAKAVAEYAYDFKDSWAGLPKEDAVYLLKGAPYRYTNKKADIGTIVHNAVEAMTNKEEVGKMTEQEQGYFQAAVAFHALFQPKPIHVEATVYSRKYKYAGTSDLFAGLRLPGEKRRSNTVIDYKTGKRIYDESAIQLCTYARGDFIAGENGEELPVPECKRGVTVLLREDGTFEARAFTFNDDLFKILLAAKVVADRERIVRACKSRPLKFTKERT